MKFYVASKFENNKAVTQTIDKLIQAGHTVTYDWTKALSNFNEDEALKCVGGVRDADFIVALLQRKLKYKGTIAEIGMAIAFNKKVYIIGDYFDNALFVHLDHIEKFSSLDEIIFKLHKDQNEAMQQLASDLESPEIKVLSIEGNIMRIQIKTAQGFLCFAPSQDFNPDGTPKPEGKICIEYRPTGGGWQDIEIIDLDQVFTQMCKFIPSTSPTPPPIDGGIPPIPPSGTEGYPTVDPTLPSLRPPYKCPTGTKFTDYSASSAFIQMGRQVGYGAGNEQMEYWQDKKVEMLQRGKELAMVPPEKYYWERLMGRGAGGADTATQGPYKGLEHYEGSLTP